MRSLRVHEEVLGRDGGRLGTIERLVVDERAHRVTHVVVHGRLVGEPSGNWRAPGGYSLSDFLAIVSALVGQEAYVPPVHLDLDLSAVHEIAPGSPVFSGSEHVGDVNQVLTDDDGDVETLVLRRPGIRGHRVRLSPDRVVEVVGTAVHVDLTGAEVAALPAYDEPG